MIHSMSLNESLFSLSENFQIEIASLKNQICREQEKNKFLESEKSWLLEQLKELKRNRFGKKSERWESAEQLTFNEVEVESKKPDPAGDTEEDAQPENVQMKLSGAVTEPGTQVQGYTRKPRGHRRALPAELPREIVKIELPKDKCFAEDGTPLKVIGWEISEKLKYEPSKLSVLEIHRAKYGVDSGDYVKTAPPAAAIIPKGIATPELLAAIAVSKYADGMPLYRIEEMLGRQGIDLTRGTMARWMVQTALAFRPVWNVLSDRLLASPYVACDETQVQVLKENGRPAEAKSWMIVRATPYGDKKVVLFDYSTSRSGATMMNLFADYAGFLQCDGLNVYDGLERDGITRLGCGMHARRRFEQAVVIGAKGGQSLGKQGLAFFKELYDLEEQIRGKPPDERYRIRQELAVPIWDRLKTWADKNRAKVPSKSKIGNAFEYFESEYKYLTAYLQDGRLEMDNGFTERAIRKFAIGRNNWIFSDTEAGAEASAILYSIVVTAKVNGVNPYTALTRLCAEVPKAETIEDFERLAEIILTPDAQPSKKA